jgi:RNA polymerase sigma-70 factor (ECF subfamily)
MPSSLEQVARWLPAARAGSTEALGRMLADCQAYLLLIAREELDPELQAKGGASDLVQETFLDAYRDFKHFQGDNEDELLAWLRRLLLNNLANFARGYRDTAKRALALEHAQANGGSSVDPAGEVRASQPSPCDLTIEREQAHALEAAVDRLPADYRRVVLLRYREELSFEVIGRLMDRSANAVEKLWLRAIEWLRQELETPP